MGLKGYRLWVMGQLDSNVQSPTAGNSAAVDSGMKKPASDMLTRWVPCCSAAGCVLERQTLKPVFSLDRL
jgi:hypothetical protein